MDCPKYIELREKFIYHSSVTSALCDYKEDNVLKLNFFLLGVLKIRARTLNK